MPRKHEPSDAEACALAIVRRVLGVDVEHRDTQAADRQGSVDGHIPFSSGRTAALEATRLADQAEMQMESVLGRADWTWPNPGRWWWTVGVQSVRHLPRLREIYAQVIDLCESLDVENPDSLPHEIQDARPWLLWLWESGSTMTGHRDVPARRDDGIIRGVMVTPQGSGGAVDETLTGLSDALAVAFARPTIAHRIDKLLADELSERHLFLAVALSGLPFSDMYGLSWSSVMPLAPPPLPAGLTHLWLAPRFSRRVLLWSPFGWTEHDPYD